MIKKRAVINFEKINLLFIRVADAILNRSRYPGFRFEATSHLRTLHAQYLLYADIDYLKPKDMSRDCITNYRENSLFNVTIDTIISFKIMVYSNQEIGGHFGKRSMMISIDRMHEILDELAAELPRAFFRDLNGGILLLDEIKMHPERRADDLYIMGQYIRSASMGKYIAIYYGSMCAVYGQLSEDDMRVELRHVLRHEFRHHIEGLAGEDGLEREDAEEMRKYLEKY